jgi:hypothetical protein
MKNTVLFLITLLFSYSANAAYFDFIGYADFGETDDLGTSYSEGSYDPFVAKEDGITLTATGYLIGSSTPAYAYLDENNAGLGVCKTNTTSCGADDNAGDGEVLKLDFGQKVQLGNTGFLNNNHQTNFGGFVQLYIDGSYTTDLYLASSLDLSAFTGQVFEFYNLSSDVGKDDFYITGMQVSAVPVPAAAFLFAPALLGFMGLRRKAAKV